MRIVRTLAMATAIAATGIAAHAGNPGTTTMEPPVAAPVEPAQGSVNGGYILVGAFALMAIASAVR